MTRTARRLRSVAAEPRVGHGERGIALVDVTMTCAVLATLAAIATPSYLEARDQPAEIAVKANLRTAALVVLTNDRFDLDAAHLAELEPSMQWTGAETESTAADHLSVVASTAGWAAAARSSTGECWQVTVLPPGVASYRSLGSLEHCIPVADWTTVSTTSTTTG